MFRRRRCAAVDLFFQPNHSLASAAQIDTRQLKYVPSIGVEAGLVG